MSADEAIYAKDIYAPLVNRPLPRHTAIIMDGNGRWATLRGLVRTAGHRHGVDTLRNIIKASVDLRLEALTVYAFSTENWRRPATEVDFLMNLFYDYLKKEIDEMRRDNVKLRFLGRVNELAPRLVALADEAVAALKDNTGLKLNVAMNYGGQDEIIRAVQKIASAAQSGKLDVASIDAATIEAELDTSGLPPVDLLIRTSGDLRLSNFLLWQAAYAEFWTTPKNWPDFTVTDFVQALANYAKRDRRFGGLGGTAVS